jgi:predicted RNA-binding protein YlxR (DUF448 family)
MSKAVKVDTDQPLRSCISCRKKGSKEDLLRTVLVNGELVLDESHTMPGRGGWVHFNCIDKAIERNAFKYAFRIQEKIATENFVARLRSPNMSAKAHTQS